jgi:hypothetical protein
MRWTSLEQSACSEPAYRVGSDRWLTLVAGGTLVSYILEGPLRYVLHQVGAESALYSRDALAVLCVAQVLLAWLRGQASAAPLAVVVVVLAAHCAIGLLSLPSSFQALFGFKVFFVFLLGFVLAPIIRRRPRALVTFSFVALLTTVLGVVLNLFVEYPWIGLSYDTAFGTTVASRQWWTTGTLRLPGFARASFTAASILVVALVPLLSAARRTWQKLAFVLLALLGITLTTTKGAWTAVAAVLVVNGAVDFLRSRQLASAMLLALAAICLGLPILAVQVGTASGAVPELLSSFMDRVGDMWPRAFGLIETPGQLLWGRGLGGIGTAQEFGEWWKANSADNLMLYVLVTFGLLGLSYVGLFLTRLVRYLGALPGSDVVASCARGWTAAWLAYGFTGGMIDLPITNMTMGLVFGLVFRMGEQPVSSAAHEASSWSAVPPATKGAAEWLG